MTTCKECYTYICETLESVCTEKTKESLIILRQFKEIFEETDKMIEDSVLQEICRNLAAIHFSRVLPLDTKPIETIRKEYLRKTGKDLPDHFCRTAYANTLRKDLEEKKLRRIKECAEIIDAEKNYHNLIEQYEKERNELQKKKQIPETENRHSCGKCQNCTCRCKGGD